MASRLEVARVPWPLVQTDQTRDASRTLRPRSPDCQINDKLQVTELRFEFPTMRISPMSKSQTSRPRTRRARGARGFSSEVTGTWGASSPQSSCRLRCMTRPHQVERSRIARIGQETSLSSTRVFDALAKPPTAAKLRRLSCHLISRRRARIMLNASWHNLVAKFKNQRMTDRRFRYSSHSKIQNAKNNHCGTAH